MTNKLKRAPEKFLAWPNNKWDADTGANETNWKVIAWVGPHTKHFDSLETAMMWIIRYFGKNVSIKNLTHQQMVMDRIRAGAASGKQPYGLSWSIKEEV